ncbi:restriction endonuclease subunit S [Enterococcus faecalis]|uniref:restriction endonuclease subunit S n=1 Tax=Enterococcus faecalis TaxID=1351 RepID=UPI0035CA0264
MKKVPRLRFRGFQEDWELCKLDDLLNEVKRPVKIEDHKEYQLVTVKRRNGGVVSRGNFKGENILVKNYFVLKKNDYLISKRQVVHGANGIVPENMDGAVVSNEYLVSVGNESIKTDYLTIISQLPQMYKLFFLSSYGIDIEKLVFNVEDWKKRTMLVPNIDEQVKIASFFKIIDDTITLHQRKLDQLKELKKAYLQVMFPGKDERVPKLRFAAFEEGWELRKLGDITKISTGKLDANAMVENGKYDFYTSGIKKYRIDVPAFEGPAITIAGNGATVGYMHLADNKFNAYQRTYVLQEFVVDRSFLFSEVGNKLPKKINQEARTGNIPYIVMDMLTELKLSIPQDEAEQSKIGSFFKQIDKTIALHQNKLEQLKDLKTSYLQNMFI